MPLTVVTDHSPQHRARRAWSRVAGVAGALLLCLGLTASIAAVPSSLAVLGLALGWIATDERDPEPWPPADLPIHEILLTWVISTPAAIAGIRGGLRLVRGRRALVLFLRRFGHDDAQSVVTFAVLRTIGASWRIVTLDDAEMAPIGLPTTTRRLFGAGRLLSRHVLAVGYFAGLRMFPLLTGTMWAVVAIALAPPAFDFAATGNPNWPQWIAASEPYLDILATVLDGDLPFAAVGPTLPGAFAALAIAAAISFVVLIGSGAALLLALPFSTVLFFASASADAVRDAERAKTAVASTVGEIREAAASIARRSRRVFGPRLVVLRVASPVWQQAVTELASVSAFVLIDVSEPTENVLWEVETLAERFGTRCVFIGQHDRIQALAGVSAGDGAAPSIGVRLARQLAGHEILAYTTDPRGLRRFARALRGLLLTRHSG